MLVSKRAIALSSRCLICSQCEAFPSLLENREIEFVTRLYMVDLPIISIVGPAHKRGELFLKMAEVAGQSVSLEDLADY